MLILCSLVAILAVSCYTVKNTVSGTEDVAFLHIVSANNGKYGTVDVTIDDNIAVKSKVQYISDEPSKDATVAVASGKHNVKIMYNNAVIYSREVYVSTSEIRTVELP